MSNDTLEMVKYPTLQDGPFSTDTSVFPHSGADPQREGKLLTVFYADEINMNEANAIVGVVAMHFRSMVQEGKIPSATKNEKGFWRFSRAAVEAYAEARKAGLIARKPSGTGKKASGTANALGKLYKVRLTPPQYEALKQAFPDLSIEAAYAWTPEKQAKHKEYQAKVKARKAAAIDAASKAKK